APPTAHTTAARRAFSCLGTCARCPLARSTRRSGWCLSCGCRSGLGVRALRPWRDRRREGGNRGSALRPAAAFGDQLIDFPPARGGGQRNVGFASLGEPRRLIG